MITNTVVIFSGRFQPFHNGHYKTYLHLTKKFPDADVYIGTSNKTDTEKSPLNFAEKQMIIETMFRIPRNRIVQLKNPYSPIEILSKYPEDSTAYITCVGEKDAGRLGGRYFLPYTSNTELTSYVDNGYVYIAPQQTNPISGTDVRKWLGDANIKTAQSNFLKAYPKFNQKIFDLIRSKLVTIKEITKSQLDGVEKFADRELKPIDVDFGKEIHHFFQRLNDPRNGKPITIPELIGFFKRLAKNRKALDKFMTKYTEFILSDRRTDINMPVRNEIDRLITKTILRKPDFRSSNPVLKIETIKHVGDKWVVYPKKGGTRLGTHDTKTSALKQLRAIEINKESIDESIILEGGAYGHMAHPFDVDMNLTFGDLKQIVKDALNGELELAREKTDGQAIAISWKNGKLISARNKGHLVNAGENAMTEDDLVNKFSGRGALSDAFAYAIADLRNAITQLPNAVRESIFKEGKAFMNCEIIYPENTNVVPYGQSLLIFHGTMEYDERGNPISENPSAGFKLADIIKKVNANVQSKFSLQGPPVQTLPKNKDLVEKQPYYLSKISKLQKEFGLNDGNGVEDYHQAWWSRWIDSNAPKRIGDAVREGLIRRWAFLEKGFRLNLISDPEIRAWAERVDKMDQQRISKSNLMKFEEIFLGVGADVLSFMKSVLVVNANQAKREMVQRLENAIASIRATGDAKSLSKLELELKRLESLGGFDRIVPNEGIVFNYKGNTYKLTGAFAPLNQILGIFTFKR